MNRITNQLWISDIVGVREQPTSDFDRVITVCQDTVDDNIECAYNFFNMADGPLSQDVHGGSLSFEHFSEAVDTLYNAIESGEVVCIHCHAGQSRSVSVAAAVIARQRDTDYDKALEIIREKRPQANPCKKLANHANKYINMRTDSNADNAE